MHTVNLLAPSLICSEHTCQIGRAAEARRVPPHGAGHSRFLRSTLGGVEEFPDGMANVSVWRATLREDGVWEPGVRMMNRGCGGGAQG